MYVCVWRRAVRVSSMRFPLSQQVEVILEAYPVVAIFFLSSFAAESPDARKRNNLRVQ